MPVLGVVRRSADVATPSRHLGLVRQLRTAIWRTAAYPIMVLVAACAVLQSRSLSSPNVQSVAGTANSGTLRNGETRRSARNRWRSSLRGV